MYVEVSGEAKRNQMLLEMAKTLTRRLRFDLVFI